MKDQENIEGAGTGNALYKVCAFIVDKRSLFFLIFILLAVFSAFSRTWVGVENSLAFYLPGTTETKQGIDLMEEEFTTYGACTVMVANVSFDQGQEIADRIAEEEGVFSVDYDNTDEYYANGSARLKVTFDYDESDDACLEALDRVKELVSGYHAYVQTSLGDITSELLDEEMSVISVLVVFVVLGVLLLTTGAYMEIPVLLITFGAGAVLQMGTNFLLGTISFVSDSVTIVLQLALSVDYAVIFLNRYKEEHQTLPPREAIIEALTKAIPEITGSSLTTIGGLIAMTFMQYQIGPDLGVVLIKAIILSLMSVFLLMPGVIMLFADAMERTKHRNFIPEIPFVGKFAYATKYVIPPLFIAVIILAYFLSNDCPYVFGKTKITAPLENRVQLTDRLISENFGTENMVAVIVPTGDYEKEGLLIRDLENCLEVDHVQGLANIEAMNGYALADRLTPRQFSELIDMDYEIAELIYSAYAVKDEDYARAINGLSEYGVPLIDMFMFLYEEVDAGYVTLEPDQQETLDDAYRQMNFAKQQLKGENYSRMLVYLNLPQESEETFTFLDKIHDMAHKYYDGTVLVCGETVSVYDLQKTFGRDNTVVNIVSILVVLVVLLFTLKSAGMPVLLIVVIQGCIWINFSFPSLMHDNIFFLSYLIVSSVQMGANIDYAIVIAGRYTENRESMKRKEAIIDSLNFALPTILTSGTMLAMAAFLIGKLTSDESIYGIGQCLSRGTVLSIFITMFVLPQILVLGDTIIAKTAFVMNMPLRTQRAAGLVRLDGVVRGQVNGTMIAVVHGIVRGEVDVHVQAGQMVEMEEPDTGLPELTAKHLEDDKDFELIQRETEKGAKKDA